MPVSVGHRLDRKKTAAGFARVAHIGELDADRAGVGRLSFTVPSLPPGLYSARMWCSACGSFLPDHKPANAVPNLGVLRVTPAQPGDGHKSAAAAGALVLLAFGAAALRLRRA